MFHLPFKLFVSIYYYFLATEGRIASIKGLKRESKYTNIQDQSSVKTDTYENEINKLINQNVIEADSHEAQRLPYYQYVDEPLHRKYYHYAGDISGPSRLPMRYGHGHCNTKEVDYCVHDPCEYGNQFIITGTPPSLYLMDLFSQKISDDLRIIPKMRRLRSYDGIPEVENGDLRSWGWDPRLERLFGIAGGGLYIDQTTTDYSNVLRSAKVKQDKVFIIGSNSYIPSFHKLRWSPTDRINGLVDTYPLGPAGCVDPGQNIKTDQYSSRLMNITDISEIKNLPGERRLRLTEILLKTATNSKYPEKNVTYLENDGFDAQIIPFTSLILGDASKGQNPDDLCGYPYDHWEFHDLVSLSQQPDTYITTFSIHGMVEYENGEEIDILHVPRVCSPNGEWNNYPTFIGRIKVDRSSPDSPSASFEVMGAASWYGFGDPDSGGDRPERSPMASDPVKCSLYEVDNILYPEYASTHVLCRDDITGRIYKININGGDFGGDLMNSSLGGSGQYHRVNWKKSPDEPGAVPPGVDCDCEFSMNCESCGFAQLIANTPYRGIRSSGGAQCHPIKKYGDEPTKDIPPWEVYKCNTFQEPGFEGSWHHSGTHCNPSVLFEENLWYILKKLKDDTSLPINIDYSQYLPEKINDRCYAVFRADDDVCNRRKGFTGPNPRRCYTRKKDGSCYVGYPLWDPIWYPEIESPYYSRNFVCRRDLYDYFHENAGDGQIWADMTKFFEMNYGMQNTHINSIMRWEFVNHWAVDSMNCYFDWIEALTGVKAVYGIGRDQREWSESQGMRSLATGPAPPLAMASTGYDSSVSNQYEALPIYSFYQHLMPDGTLHHPYDELTKEWPGRPGKFGFLFGEFLTPINDMCLREIPEATGWWGHQRLEQRLMFNVKVGPIRSWQALAIPNTEANGGITHFGGENVGDHNYMQFLIDYLSANDIFDWNEVWNPDKLDESGRPIKDIRDPSLKVNNKAIHAERFYDPETLRPISPNLNVATTYADASKFIWPLELMMDKGSRLVNANYHPLNGDPDDNELFAYDSEPVDTGHIQKNPTANQFQYTSEIMGYLTGWIFDPLMPFGDYDLKPPILTDIATATQLYGWRKIVDRMKVRAGDNLMEGCINDDYNTLEDSPGSENEYKCVPLRAALCGPNRSKLDQCTNLNPGSKFNMAKNGILDDAAQNKRTFWRISPNDEILDMNTISVGGHAWEWTIPDIGVALEWGEGQDQGPSVRLNYRFDKCAESVMKTTSDYPKRSGENVAEGLGYYGGYRLGPGAWGPHTWNSSICDAPYELSKIWTGGSKGNMLGVKQEDKYWSRSKAWGNQPWFSDTPQGEIALAHSFIAQACYARQARGAGTKINGPGDEGDHMPLSSDAKDQWGVPGLGGELLAYQNHVPEFIQ